MISDPAGKIRVCLQTRVARVSEVTIHSTRRTDLSQRLFAGRPLDYLLTTLPRVFSVCGTAQACAAARASEAALSVTVAPAQQAARDILVTIETAREHLLRILIGWSEWLDERPPVPSLALVGRMRSDWERALFPAGDGFELGGGRLQPDWTAAVQLQARLTALIDGILGMPPSEWLDLGGLAGFEMWSGTGNGTAQRLTHMLLQHDDAALGQSGVACLPAFPDSDLAERMSGADASAFLSQPDWGGRTYETGALQRCLRSPLVAALYRQFGNGLLTRLVARLDELARAPSQVAALVNALEEIEQRAQSEDHSGAGLAQVEAARGRLVHWIEIEDCTVRRYRILAPTEWNFHPQGVLAQGLRTLPAGDRLPRLAGLLVDAVDPCVDSRIEVLDDA